MGAFLTILFEKIQSAWRFRRVAVLVAWAVCLVGWAGVLMLPDTYEASARVFVDTRTRLRDVTQGLGVASNIDTQIQRVRQALLGGPELEKVVQAAFPEYASATPQRRQALAGSLRDRIEINATTQNRDESGAGVYTLSFKDGDRENSLAVVRLLVNTFAEGTLGGNRQGSEQAQRFLVDQISDYEKRLSSAEERLADFKKQNVGLMPGAQGDYFTRLQAEMAELEKARQALGVAQRKRDELSRQLTGEPIVGGMRAAVANAGLGGKDAAGGADTATRIQQTQARIDELLLQFTEKHPDVIALRQTLADLKVRLQAEIDAAKKGDPSALAQLGANANPVLQSIRMQLNQADVDIASLRAQIGDGSVRIDNLRKLVNTAPEVEAEFSRLNRDYEVTRAQYQALVERLERTRLTDQADQTGAVTFEVIDPAAASFEPVAPNRPRLILLVLIAGLGLGCAAAYLLHEMRPVFSSSRQLQEITGLPVLGIVSMTWLARHQALARRRVWVYSSLAASLVLLAVVMLAVESSASRFVQRFI
jgi:polysaccharide chain length determinant protein (PEP-CTERM system associated)